MDVGSPELAIIRREGQEPVRRRARAPGHEHGDQPRRRSSASSCAGSRCRPARSCRRSSTATTRSSTPSPRVDVAKAKALLAEAGYPNGFSVIAALPERPLSQRRGDLPGRGRHARPDRHQGEPGLAVEVAALPDRCRSRKPTSTCSAGAFRPTTSEYIFSYLYHTRDGTLRRLERDALLQPRSRQADPEPVGRDRYRQAQRHDRADLGASCSPTRSTSRSITRCSPTP